MQIILLIIYLILGALFCWIILKAKKEAKKLGNKVRDKFGEEK